MKQITLIRHAKVDIDNSHKINASSLSSWIEEYDSAPIHTESLPSCETIKHVQCSDVVLTSTLKRAIDSANVLGGEVVEQNKLFNEAAIPEVSIPYLKLKPKSWLVVLRLMLFLGLGKKDTSLKASKVQAKEAVKILLEYVTKHNHVVLVGHGGMNWLLGKELVKEGWVLEGNVSHENWGATVLHKSK